MAENHIDIKFTTPEGDRIREAQKKVLDGIRPWLYYNDGGDLCIQLNAPNTNMPDSPGSVISHRIVLSEHKPENIKELKSVVRGWVMGVASTMDGKV